MKTDDSSDFQKIVETAISRRTFLKGGASFGLSRFALGGALGGAGLSACTSDSDTATVSHVLANSDDTITLAADYQWKPVISWGDPLFSSAKPFSSTNRTADQAQSFGDNNDGMSLFQIEGKQVLVVNNEYFNYDLMFPDGIKSDDDLQAVKEAYGVSIVEIEKIDGRWQPVIDGKLNRRITMDTPMDITGPARGHPYMRTKFDSKGIRSFGTWANCGNGETPWGTYLACEENFNMSFSNSKPDVELSPALIRYGFAGQDSKVAIYKIDERFDIGKHPNEANRCGYVVEIDPSDPSSIPKKRTALGRFMHENAEVVVNKDGHVVVYMGDDSKGEFLYKFVSKDKYQKDKPKANKGLLEKGTLYVAKFGEADDDLSGKGEWIELSYGKNGLIIENGFASQAEVCIKTRMAASLVGATTMDRPEWVAAHPKKAEVYCALTNNSHRGIKPNGGGDATPLQGPNPREKNLYGQIVRWRPTNGDHTSTTFEWDLFVVAGNPVVHKDNLYAGSDNITADNMFNSPDGIGFDSKGGLWIQTDGKYINKGQYAGMGNNQMLRADTTSGKIERFMVAPIGAEVTGMAWSDDETTLFVGIQHPGEKSTGSHFPEGGDSVPRSTVIAIERKDGRPLSESA